MSLYISAIRAAASALAQYVFTLAYTKTNPNPFGTSLDDSFGLTCGTSDSWTISGAHWEDETSYNNSGKAYVFNNATGALIYTFDDPNTYSTPADDNFGVSTAICESYAIVGARYEDSAGGSQSGAAYIFDMTDGSLLWTLTNPNTDTYLDTDQFGAAVSICESYSLVTAPQEDDALYNAVGIAYIFDNSDGSLLWTLLDGNAYGTTSGDAMGTRAGSAAICESYAVVTADRKSVV
jgi:hypothetical protein